MKKDDKIYIAGHTGMVGSAILRRLQGEGYTNLVLRTQEELELLDQRAVFEFYQQEKPQYVFDAAAKVGGIMANNTFRGQFIYENLQIQNNVIHGAHLAGVEKLLFLGSSCIYPKYAEQPIREEALLSGKLEPTNEPYAIAKIAGVKMCQAYQEQYGDRFISCMPTNLYGPNDNFDLHTSHVFAALLRKFHDAKAENRDSVEVWGSGKPKREFLHVDDLAAACEFLMLNYEDMEIINVGSGFEVSIAGLAEMMAEVIGFEGKIEYNRSKPDGTPRKMLDSAKIRNMGWKPQIDLKTGIRKTYAWYLNTI
jgi:GDP-L-fucose synthase